MRSIHIPFYVLLVLTAGIGGMLLGAGLPASANHSASMQRQDSRNTAGSGEAVTGAYRRPTETAPNRLHHSPIDAGFARAMLVHHNQALLLADIVKNHPSTDIREFANAIRLKQLHENGQMRGWLTVWGEPEISARPMDWVEQTTQPLSAEDVLYISRCSANPEQMPGAITADELSRLKVAHPAEQSTLFQQYMRRHHEGAIDMARFAMRHSRLPFVRSFALGVIREQAREIEWINRQLASKSIQLQPTAP